MVGKPQTLSKGQEDHVTRLLRRKLLRWVLVCFAILAGLTGASLWGILKRAETTMENMVAKQFEEPRIRAVVTQVAAERATVLMSSEISPQVAEFKSNVADELREVEALVDKTRALEAEGQQHKASIINIAADLDAISTRTDTAERRLSDVEREIAIADTTLHDLQERLDSFDHDVERMTREQIFLSLANRARLYSLEAFLELEALSHTADEYAPDAHQLVWSLRREMELDRTQRTEYVPIEQLDDYSYRGPYSSEEVAQRLRERKTVEGGANLARRENLQLFIPQLVIMARDELNLWVQNRITYALSTLTGENFMPWDVAELEKWWISNEENYPSWPYDLYDEAMSHLASVRYSDALIPLEAIISLDDYADKSRALAIACALEIGDTERASTLGAAWKHPDGRWARWSKAITTLHGDDREEAAKQFAELAAEFRTFPPRSFLRQGNHLFRRLDWTAYNRKLNELMEND